MYKDILNKIRNKYYGSYLYILYYILPKGYDNTVEQVGGREKFQGPWTGRRKEKVSEPLDGVMRVEVTVLDSYTKINFSLIFVFCQHKYFVYLHGQ